MQTHYVAGFLFGRDQTVLLVEKRKPEWQNGWLNAIGGKINPGESAVEAMVREFREETTIDGQQHGIVWQHFVRLDGPVYRVEFFRAVVDKLPPFSDVNDAGEAVRPFLIEALVKRNQWRTMPNLSWLIPMALDPSAPCGALVDTNGLTTAARDPGGYYRMQVR